MVGAFLFLILLFLIFGFISVLVFISAYKGAQAKQNALAAIGGDAGASHRVQLYLGFIDALKERCEKGEVESTLNRFNAAYDSLMLYAPQEFYNFVADYEHFIAENSSASYQNNPEYRKLVGRIIQYIRMALDVAPPGAPYNFPMLIRSLSPIRAEEKQLIDEALGAAHE